MAKHTVFILGDSTSMTIGCERHMYPFVMADRACWPESTEVVNCSQPGFTSADACAFFFHHRKEFPSLSAVVIHLGTCDAASWELRKGKYTYFKESMGRLKKTLGVRQERTRLKNRLLHFEWNSTFDPDIELPESPEDYEFNISRIVETCAKSAIAVIMVRPKSNPLFFPGVGKGNFVFYHYLGLNDVLSPRLSIPDGRFLEALGHRETGDPAGAAEKFREILQNSGKLASHYEYPLLVVNNYAVCVAEKGDLEEAESLLQLLLKERCARREIVLFNLAEIYRMRGDHEKYRRYLSESYESDSSMYRIRAPYLEAIDRVSARFEKSVHAVDIESFIEDDLYVDHTHPLKEGQGRIADRIVEYFGARGLRGAERAEVRNILYNPELALGNTTEFYTYFRTYAPFREEEITGQVNRLLSTCTEHKSNDEACTLLQGLPRELKTALEYHLMHPCFPSLSFLVHYGPRYPSDIGRFPEYFLVRHLIPYLRLYENHPSLVGQFSSDTDILRKSKDLLSILPPEVVPLVSKDDPPFDRDLETRRLPAILHACRQALIAHLRRGNQVHERMKTTIFWYFRELLRYGSHSRISMRYERTILELTAEALVVATLINLKLGMDRGEEIAELIRYLEETVRIHDHYCRKFTVISHSGDLLAEYDRRLSENADRLEIR